MRDEYIAIIPAAGKGSRISSIVYPKELAMIHDSKEPVERPKVILEFCFENLINANIQIAHVIISSNKMGLINFIKDGSNHDMKISYLYQNEPEGIVPAIALAFPFSKEKFIVLMFPDAIVYPKSVLKDLIEYFETRSEEVILGIFPSDAPEELCQVITDQNSNVKKLLEKSTKIEVQNTWGIAIWKPSFNNYLIKHMKRIKTKKDKKEYSISEVFNAAIRDGIKIISYSVPHSYYFDIGTPGGLKKGLTFFFH